MRIERVSRHFDLRPPSTWALLTAKRRGVCLRRYGVDCGNRSPYTIGSLAAWVLERFDLETELLAQGAGDEAANAVRLPAGCAHQVLQGSAAGAFQQGHNLGLFCVLSACVRVLLARGLLGGLAPGRRDVAAVCPRDEALDSPPDPSCRYGAVCEPLDRRQTWNSVPDIDQAAAGPIGSQLRKFLFAGELLAPLVGDFGCSAVSSDVVFRVDGKDRHGFLLNRGCGHHIHHSGGRRKQGILMLHPAED